jgi:anti-sigma B factor antagonist
MSRYQRKASVQVRKAGDNACVLDVGGEITAFAEDALMTAYNEACNAVPNVILNFGKLEYMSSSGIGLLVTLLIRAQRQQQRLLACELSEHYRNILELTRLNEAIVIYATEAEALAAASTAGEPARG